MAKTPFRPSNPYVGNRREMTYTEKVWQTVAIVALIVSVILIARVAFNVVLMIMAGCLIATYFHGVGDVVERRFKVSRQLAMVVSVVGTLSILALLLWFMGTTIQSQVEELSKTLPATINNVKAKLDESSIGHKILEGFSSTNSKTMVDTAQSFFTTSFGVLGDLYIIMFLGIFFTSNPSMYKDGILLLVPKNRKLIGIHIMNRISTSLKGWLKGMMASIVLVTILITTGLTIMGIPVAMVLGLITGILEIVPNFGSVLAMIPGTLLALTVDTKTGIIVALIYITSQTITANIVNPLIQRKLIKLPPALTLISQLIMGVVSGPLGIILAVPMLAILMILIDELYVKKINPEGAKVPSTDDVHVE
ncbi:AI-2E family transporter [Mucilaginibacter myungsuensis]|uniref:AI-2E family transporter n=1 Tax=Mucilaginibacter myungsuensis TaxID=649104 RepID=A0A929PZ54_9SPHI|nr:AI-2E family transporter [Mucilaginibacter myungsuensis]MBE9664042.1 AI-2E family transporter [Mucilaginibacter myungsuensis]MDN3601221.1 AI-2E family transporter [Mucilaginibacter myungsuensis]